MINETFARTHFAGENPVGQKVLGRILEGKTATIVGVVRDARHWGLREKARPAVYFPSGQFSRFWTPEFILRTNVPLTDVTAMVRRAVAAVDGQLRLTQIQTLDKMVNDYLERERLLASLSSMFGSVALILAAVGVYGVIAYGVTRRMNEIGLRMALGANRAQVLRMIIRDAAIIPVIGIAAGAPLAFAASRIAESLLFGVKPRDVMSLGVSGALIFAMAIIAAVIPARRAMRIDPITVLRHE
jgi:predicted lysophospholipase L1 biosynthesis ABC-type transport system permease subunit